MRITSYCKDTYSLYTVFESIEDYAPGFRELVIAKDVLTPPDLEKIFGLTGGNIFHGAMSIDQLYLARPTHLNPSYASGAVKGLYLCGSGAHPGELCVHTSLIVW